MDIVLVLTLITIFTASFYIATFLMIVNQRNWAKRRDEYYEQRFLYNEEVAKVLNEVKEILNQINKINGTRNESMD